MSDQRDNLEDLDKPKGEVGGHAASDSIPITETIGGQPTLSQSESSDVGSDEGIQTLRAGSRIGRYTIETILGVGGMGAVYRASQQAPKRTVALKVMKPGLMSPRALRRFELESEMLGRLSHPGIASIYEAGVHEGSPFFAMEHVDGSTLMKYAADRKLGTRERLALFAKICDAVHHAHAKGIIHRDLKPHNILVTEVGDPQVAQPKVLDFGVARATDAEYQTATLMTDVGQIVGTVPYMSPEQVAADPEDIDTRSDVYALGVVLYELLAGRMPYDLRAKMIHEAARVIREDEPTRLSSINTTLRGDVETIVAKALEKERERRYQTALEFGSDIRHYLADEPIDARPPSVWYQIQKFSKRNKVLVVSAVLLVFAMVLGLGGTSYGLLEAQAQRGRAEVAAQAEKQRAEEAITQRQRAEEAEAQAKETLNELQQVSDFQAERLRRIDPRLMGETIRESVLGEVPADQRDAFEASLSSINFTNTAMDTLSETIFEPTIEAIDEQFDDQPVVRARLLQSTANSLQELGLLELAMDPQHRALQIRRDALGDDDRWTIASLNSLGNLLLDQGKIEEAEGVYREALETSRRIFEPTDSKIISVLNNYARILGDLGRLEDAEQYYLEALAASRVGLGEDHPATLDLMNNLGMDYISTGRFEEAEPLLRDSMDRHRAVYGEEHERTLNAINNMGFVYGSQGRFEEAAPYQIQALEGMRRVLGDEHPRTLALVNNTGYVLTDLGRFEQAEPLTLEAMRGYRSKLGDAHPHTHTCYRNTVRMYTRWHEADPDAGHDQRATAYQAELDEILSRLNEDD